MAAESAPEGLTSTTTDEHTPGGATTTDVLSLYRVNDDEDDLISTTTLMWTISGPDADMFEIDAITPSDGITNCDYGAKPAQDNCAQLRFDKPIDFENPTDSNRDNKYHVTVNATDMDKMTVSRNVVVTVRNVNEGGTITLSHLQPEVGTPFRATLTDPDGGEREVTWQWAKCPTNSRGADGMSCSAALTQISGAVGLMQAYTPVIADSATSSEEYLHVTASYFDAASPEGQSVDKWTASRISMLTVQREVENNTPPSLPDGTLTREVAESAGPGAPVGGSDGDDPQTGLILASDLDNDAQAEILLYELEGPDKDLFTVDTIDVDSQTDPKVIGRIRVGEGTELDYDAGRRTYTVVVRATDPAGLSDTVTVNINVTDVDEMPELSRADVTITGDTRIDYPENSTAEVQTYGVMGADAGTPTWSISGADRSAFSISSAGVLTFNSPPDFEAARDTGGNNVYEVSVQAMSGGVTSSRDVTVTVTDVEEPGSVTISSVDDEVKVGVELTAELSDGDEEDPASVTWQWERGSSANGPWNAVGQATNNTYTPVETDVGSYLRAVVTYDDPHGTGKTLNAVTNDAVAAETGPGTDGAVSLSPSSGLVSGNSVTATLTDSDNPVSLTWTWQTSANGSTNWTAAPSAVSSSGLTSTYTTADADAGNYLRASVTYNDDSGTGQTAGPSAPTGRVAIDSYDANSDGTIDGTEVLEAVADYFQRRIDGNRVLDVVALYFDGL